jgi:hypothetical protein
MVHGMRTNINLAAYNDRRAAVHEAAGNTERAAVCRKNAEQFRKFEAERSVSA